MSEDSSVADDNNNDTKPTSHSRRSKREEIFGFPKDDVTLGLAAAGLGLAGLVGAKIVSDMVAEGKLPNPFAPNNPKISYTDVYEQQRQQQAWEAQQAAQQQQQQQQLQQHQQQHQHHQETEGGDPAAGTMPAYTPDENYGFDEENTEQFSTAPPKRNDRFSRVNVG